MHSVGTCKELVVGGGPGGFLLRGALLFVGGRRAGEVALVLALVCFLDHGGAEAVRDDGALEQKA